MPISYPPPGPTFGGGVGDAMAMYQMLQKMQDAPLEREAMQLRIRQAKEGITTEQVQREGMRQAQQLARAQEGRNVTAEERAQTEEGRRVELFGRQKELFARDDAIREGKAANIRTSAEAMYQNGMLTPDDYQQSLATVDSGVVDPEAALLEVVQFV